MISLVNAVVIITIIYIIVRYMCKKSKFTRHMVLHLEKYPIFGNTIELLEQTRHITDVVQDNYNAFPYKERFIGFYHFGTPILILKDLKLIKQVCIDEFDSFHDHFGFVADKVDPIFANNLYSLQGQKWQDMRTILRGIFNNSQLIEMYKSVNVCSNRMIAFLQKTDGKLEAKTLCSMFTNDVIASIAFGEDVNSFCSLDNEFLKYSQTLISQTRLKSEHSQMEILQLALKSNLPMIAKYFRKPVLSHDVSEYFKNIIVKNIEKRKLGKEKKYDLIQEFIMHSENRNGNSKIDLNDNEMTAQAIIFLISGFETMATFMSFLIYELAVNPDVQTKLQDEIDMNIDKLETGDRDTNGFAALNEFKYLKMVISEALRLWPPVIITDRKCTKKYNLGPPNVVVEQSYEVEVNESLWIPIFSIHRDPNYFKDPDLFVPERFSDEQIKHMHPFSYLPFGMGPRCCIAMKFALLEVKLAVVRILQKFTIKKTKQTQIPLQLKTSSLNMQTENGIFVKFVKRKDVT